MASESDLSHSALLQSYTVLVKDCKTDVLQYHWDTNSLRPWGLVSTMLHCIRLLQLTRLSCSKGHLLLNPMCNPVTCAATAHRIICSDHVVSALRWKRPTRTSSKHWFIGHLLVRSQECTWRAVHVTDVDIWVSCLDIQLLILCTNALQTSVVMDYLYHKSVHIKKYPCRVRSLIGDSEWFKRESDLNLVVEFGEQVPPQVKHASEDALLWWALGKARLLKRSYAMLGTFINCCNLHNFNWLHM